jgi:hypothetical protein
MAGAERPKGSKIGAFATTATAISALSVSDDRALEALVAIDNADGDGSADALLDEEVAVLDGTTRTFLSLGNAM